VELQDKLIQEEALLKHQVCLHLYNHSVSVILGEVELHVVQVPIDTVVVAAELAEREIRQLDLQMVVVENL
jgi:hypothetical protein